MASRRNRSRRQAAAILQYSDSEGNADQYYFGRFQAPDPFISMQIGGKKIAFLSRLEIGRARKESIFDHILSLEEWRDKARRVLRIRSTGPADVIRLYCQERKIRRIRVGSDFSVGLAFRLQKAGLDLEIAPGMLFPQREIKSDQEAAAIAEGNRCSAAGIRAAERVLRQATIFGNTLIFERRRLTSERLRLEIEKTCLEMGSVSQGTIVAGGAQACDPHCRGSGLLRPHQLIILDVFPRVIKTGYHGDLTRTFLKGHASDAQRRLVATVRGAQKIRSRPY